MRIRHLSIAMLLALPLGAQARPVILVTGSTDGLGREVAMRAAATGAHVLVHGRSAARGDSVVAAIRAQGVGTATFYQADFTDLASVRRMAAEVMREHPRLDVLVNNAGIYPDEGDRQLTADGYERAFTINYLAPFLLTRLLMPALLHERPARIVNVASLSQQALDLDDLMMTRGYTAGRSYAQSKLAQIIFTMDLAPQLEGTMLRVVALHPATMMPTAMVVGRGAAARSTLDDGASAVMRLVTMPDLPNGGYFNSQVAARANAQAYDPVAQRRLRELSEQLTSAPPLPTPRR
jgi:NAD(P)-dependent dehydrogenase (short-subunit alcohol dehydrogenase family)